MAAKRTTGRGTAREKTAGKTVGKKPAGRRTGAERPAVEKPDIVVPGPGLRRWFRPRRYLSAVALMLVLLLALPLVLMPVYRLSGARPISTLMLGRVLTLQPVERHWVALDAIAPVMQQSVIMSEDGQFCFHRGVDLAELKAVVDDALDGGATRGASTIPMQTVKNLYLWPQRSYVRKVFEIPYALVADAVWSKRRILELYLNIAEFGDGIFGVEAASRHYFKRPAAELSRRQAALLAVTLPNPGERNPAKPSKLHNKLADRIERLSAKSGAYVKCLGARDRKEAG
ncbi:MAG: monofunctional biosynthetic peptidoglycan transglycosylase [Nitratireductor sp.]|nr:monofunctional biosynthetic peptidoglycan transglycosylase [Nitratireductor sp.]